MACQIIPDLASLTPRLLYLTQHRRPFSQTVRRGGGAVVDKGHVGIDTQRAVAAAGPSQSWQSNELWKSKERCVRFLPRPSLSCRYGRRTELPRRLRRPLRGYFEMGKGAGVVGPAGRRRCSGSGAARWSLARAGGAGKGAGRAKGGAGNGREWALVLILHFPSSTWTPHAAGVP